MSPSDPATTDTATPAARADVPPAHLPAWPAPPPLGARMLAVAARQRDARGVRLRHRLLG